MELNTPFNEPGTPPSRRLARRLGVTLFDYLFYFTHVCHAPKRRRSGRCRSLQSGGYLRWNARYIPLCEPGEALPIPPRGAKPHG